MKTAKREKRGFRASCPLCGQEDKLYVNLDDVTVLRCTDCDGEIEVDDLRERIETWTEIIAWLGLAPPRP